eukprot:1095024-Prymnesium_polylepis.1
MSGLMKRVLFGRRMMPGAMPALLDGGHLEIFTHESRSLIGGYPAPLAAALCHHLLAHRAALKLGEGLATLELGAGTGAVGLYAAALGARCTLTEKQPPRAATITVSYTADGDLDLPEGYSRCLLELLQLNVEANRSHCHHEPVVCQNAPAPPHACGMTCPRMRGDREGAE